MAATDKLGPSNTRTRTVLITGCSDGGLGASLAIALHKAGLKVYATGRNLSKLEEVRAHGIQTFAVDVLSQESISVAAQRIQTLDILINNAGGLYSMPVSDMSISKAKELFDLNVWSYLAVTQSFLPHLRESRGIIVNHTSSAGLLPLPFQSAYNASKAAMIMFTDCMRLELAPFGVKVVDLKSASAGSNGFANQEAATGTRLPKSSWYEDAREDVEKTMRGERFPVEVTAEEWADQVVGDLLKGGTPPSSIWRGTKAWVMWLTSLRPLRLPEFILKKMTALDVVERVILSTAP